MATIFNKTKCEDCIHGQVCVKKNDFKDLVEQINDIKITVFDHGNDRAKSIALINNERFSAHLYIECDYFIKKQGHSMKYGDGILLCEKNIKDN